MFRVRKGAGNYSEVSARTGSLETYYHFSGNVAVKDSQTVTVKSNVTLRELYVAQDQQVTVGDPLARLSNGDIIKADIGGEVTRVHVSVGDNLSPGTALMEIISFGNLQVIMKIDEFDVSAVSAGKEAQVTINALGLDYVTPIEHISKQAQTVGDVNYYEAKLGVPVDEHILPGMKVSVKVLSQRVDDAVLLPLKALRFDSYNEPYVYVHGSDGKVISLPVTAGIQDGITVQILNGLRAGDVALIPQSSTLFPFGMGMRSR